MEWFAYVKELKNDISAQKNANQRDNYRRTQNADSCFSEYKILGGIVWNNIIEIKYRRVDFTQCILKLQNLWT